MFRPSKITTWSCAGHGPLMFCPAIGHAPAQHLMALKWDSPLQCYTASPLISWLPSLHLWWLSMSYGHDKGKDQSSWQWLRLRGCPAQTHESELVTLFALWEIVMPIQGRKMVGKPSPDSYLILIYYSASWGTTAFKERNITECRLRKSWVWNRHFYYPAGSHLLQRESSQPQMLFCSQGNVGCGS